MFPCDQGREWVEVVQIMLGKDYCDLVEEVIKEKKVKKFTKHRELPDRKINGVLLEFLHPPESSLYDMNTNYHSRINNHSLVIRLTYQNISMLFTGDISREAE